MAQGQRLKPCVQVSNDKLGDCHSSFPLTRLCACDSLMKDYFYKPPINKLSLTFLEKSLESAYRISYQEEVCVCVCVCV